MSLCIAGKNEVAVRTLRELAGVMPLLCLPNPDDDGVDRWQPSLRRAATDDGVPIVELGDLYGMPDLTFLSLEYSRIVDPGKFASGRLFNMHFSLLPKYRGCNTAVWPILNGEREHGVTLHCIDRGIDTGAIIDQRAFALDGMTAFESYMRCQDLGFELAVDWAARLCSGDYPSVPQGEGTTYARSALDYDLANIDLGETTEQVIRRVRAFTFPVYQLPSLDGVPIVGASAQPVDGWNRYATRDGAVWLAHPVTS